MTWSLPLRIFLLVLTIALRAEAQARPASQVGNPITLLLILGAVSLIPFIAIMLTSFIKVSIVLSMIKNAFGGQQAPPQQVTNGLAFILSIFIMTPVALDMYRAAGPLDSKEPFSTESVTSIYRAAQNGKEPLRRFLLAHAHPADRALFVGLAGRLKQSARARESLAGVAVPPETEPPQAAQVPGPLPDEEFSVVIPAFVTSELKEAFQIGFLILLPFLVIDMVVATILVALGMSMLQPATVSLPFKLLLFVLADGWILVVKGLVLSYT